MVQKTVLKVDISCQKCKKKILKAVSALEGVDKIEVDAAKGILTVTGNADPYEIIVGTRKVSKLVEVVSIGPPPAPAPTKQDGKNKPEEKKSEQKPSQTNTQIHNPFTCPVCEQMTAVVHVQPYQQPAVTCSIM